MINIIKNQPVNLACEDKTIYSVTIWPMVKYLESTQKLIGPAVRDISFIPLRLRSRLFSPSLREILPQCRTTGGR